MLSAQDLLAGSSLEHSVEVPETLLDPSSSVDDHMVRIRPLSIKDFQLIHRAAKESDSLMAVLMVHRALLDPQLSVAEVNAMPVGLLHFLLERVNEISGVNTSEKQLDEAIEAPLSQAAFVLAQRFGWTPEQVGDMTLGQILVSLRLCQQHPGSEGDACPGARLAAAGNNGH